jgi:hypothetical protein
VRAVGLFEYYSRSLLTLKWPNRDRFRDRDREERRERKDSKFDKPPEPPPPASPTPAAAVLQQMQVPKNSENIVMLWYLKLLIRLTFSQYYDLTIYYENVNSTSHLYILLWLHAQTCSLYGLNVKNALVLLFSRISGSWCSRCSTYSSCKKCIKFKTSTAPLRASPPSPCPQHPVIHTHTHTHIHTSRNTRIHTHTETQYRNILHFELWYFD